QLLVDGDHLPAHWREELGHGLDRLNRPKRLARGDRAANLRKLDIHDDAKLLLGIIGDAFFASLAVDPNPFVVLGVLPVGRIRHASLRAGLRPTPSRPSKDSA